MQGGAPAGTPHVDGLDGSALAAMAGVPRVALHAALPTTMDEAHRLAQDGAPDGTVVIADQQTSGRGRLGRLWQSHSHRGLWMTIVARDVAATGLDVLSLRIGLALARALDQFAETPVGLKWPNDLFVGGQKLAGILVEARWRQSALEWAAVGIGINLDAPADQPGAAALRAGASRAAVFAAIASPVRAACRVGGELTTAEVDAFAGRDIARGRRLVEPTRGVANGITAAGALVVQAGSGEELFRQGSLVFETEVR